MGRDKRKQAAGAASRTQRAGSGAGSGAGAHAQQTSTISAGPTAKSRSWRIWLLLVPILALLGLAFWLKSSRPVPAPAGVQGSLLGCRQLPLWLGQRAASQGAALSTAEARLTGLAFIDPQAAPYQHASWSKAGNLGPIIFDRRGYVFVLPIPKINLLDNRPGEQNTLWRVDAVSEQLTRYLSLPSAHPVDVNNPYGLLGLSYDCETDLLYVSSVQGSSRHHERGAVHVISAQEPRSISSHALGDFMGIALFRGRSGKRIYLARARSSEVVSYPLDAKGKIFGDARSEFSLAALGPRGDDVARRMTASGADRLTVYGVEFAFNLVAPTEKKETRYEFQYDASQDRFGLTRIGQIPVSPEGIR